MTEKADDIVDVKEFDKTTYYFRRDKIIIIRVHPNVLIELEDSKKEQAFLHEEKADHLPMKIMIVGAEGSSVSKEVRDYSNHPDNTSMIKAEALVTTSLGQKIMANFIMNFYKTPMPIKVFSNEEQAINWLIDYK